MLEFTLPTDGDQRQPYIDPVRSPGPAGVTIVDATAACLLFRLRSVVDSSFGYSGGLQPRYVDLFTASLPLQQLSGVPGSC